MDEERVRETSQEPWPPPDSPSDRIAAWVLGRWRKATFRAGPSSGPGLLRRALVTLGLLLLWQGAHFIPLPVLRPDALAEFAHQYRDGLAALLFRAWPQTSVLSLGYGSYLTAHLVVFWIVMVVPPLRRMGFVYRRGLDLHVLGLSLLLGVLEGFTRLTWCSNLVSPTGQRVVAPFFGAHPVVFRVVGLCALLAGLAFTLLVLRLIGRFGLRFPLTCMVVWDILFPVVRQLVTLRADALHAEDPHGYVRGAILVVAAAALGLGLLAAFWIYTGEPAGGAEREVGEAGKRGRWLSGEPSLFVFGLLSTAFLMAWWRAARKVPPLFGEGGQRLSEALALPDLGGAFGNRVLSTGVALGLALLSTLLLHRLFYNIRLRRELGARLGSPGSPASSAVWRAFGAWCLLCSLVWIGMFLRETYFPTDPILECLAGPYSWDVVFLLVAAAGAAFAARDFRLGFVAPVYSHGYYEPLYAVKALLGEKGVPSVLGGEPYALLHGIIVGPVARKELLVRESDRERALELIRRAGVLDGGTPTWAPKWAIFPGPEPATPSEQPPEPPLP